MGDSSNREAWHEPTEWGVVRKCRAALGSRLLPYLRSDGVGHEAYERVHGMEQFVRLGHGGRQRVPNYRCQAQPALGDGGLTAKALVDQMPGIGSVLTARFGLYDAPVLGVLGGSAV